MVQTDQFVPDMGPGNRRGASGVKGRRDFNHIAAFHHHDAVRQRAHDAGRWGPRGGQAAAADADAATTTATRRRRRPSNITTNAVAICESLAPIEPRPAIAMPKVAIEPVVEATVPAR